MDKFNKDLKTGKYIDKVNMDLKFGQKLGITSVPVYFIDGKPIPGVLPTDSFVKMIGIILKEKNKK
jgi:predicted DsbA family dithiol-disulfide isomerase